MNVLDLRNKIFRFVSNADEKRLREIEAFIHMQNEEFELTDEDRTLIDERLKLHEENPDSGTSWEDLKASLSSKYDV